MIKLPFADRAPTPAEVERIRLLLSTYQDGSGMERGGLLPGWRDFERCVALALGGVAAESKTFFDVALHDPTSEKRPLYGLSCKMRGELARFERDGRATIEVSNANGDFWRALNAAGLTQANYETDPALAGRTVVGVIDSMKSANDKSNGGRFDTTKSYYLVLLWNKKLEYQLFQYPLNCLAASALAWHIPKDKKDVTKSSRRLSGDDKIGTAVEWYGMSGGQLKYYPPESAAVWKSSKFRLEPVPAGTSAHLAKAATYFPKQWAAVKL